MELNLLPLKTWVIGNWEVIAAVVIGMIIIYFAWRFSNRNKKPKIKYSSISQEILEYRQDIRKLDSLLEDMQTYFDRLESKIKAVS